MQLRGEGYTYREIGSMLVGDAGEPMSHVSALEMVREGLAELREHGREVAADLRDILLDRLTDQHKALWYKRDDPRTADTLLRISQRISDLVGLDAPKSIRLGGDGSGLPIKVEGSTVALTMSERATRLREFGIRDVSALAGNGHGNGNGAHHN
jgi:hypothetical protein